MSYHNPEYKPAKADELGKHVMVHNTILTDKDISPSVKLIYAYIRGYMNRKTGEALVGIEKLSLRTKYSSKTILTAAKTLRSKEYIHVSKRSGRNLDGSGYVFNVYTFPFQDDSFERITHSFLYSSLPNGLKEFILCLIPLTYNNRFIGSFNNPTSITRICNETGLTYKTVAKKISELKNLGVLIEKGSSGVYGYEINMELLMSSALENVVNERNDLIYEIAEMRTSVKNK